jgi:hypothetical protein
MKIYKFSPSSDFASMDIGALFSFQEGQWFKLIKRDAINCYAVRYTWWYRLKSAWKYLWESPSICYKKEV